MYAVMASLALLGGAALVFRSADLAVMDFLRGLVWQIHRHCEGSLHERVDAVARSVLPGEAAPVTRSVPR
jgi:hypothetical protein